MPRVIGLLVVCVVVFVVVMGLFWVGGLFGISELHMATFQVVVALVVVAEILFDQRDLILEDGKTQLLTEIADSAKRIADVAERLEPDDPND
jgi:hypothetical protein